MRINHNIASLNTYRQLSANSTNSQKSIEKLSSGLRINRAGDDAAGLAISEKMRGQIRGLEQSSRNAQDGISLIQTAEGALNETHSILQRMRELAVQAANDTNTSTDRSEIQKEINQLTQEIDRIGNTTEFNTKKLLNGSAGVAVSASNTAITNLSGTADTQAGTIALTAANITMASKATVAGGENGGTAASNFAASSSITINGTTFSFTTSQTYQNALDIFNAASATTGVTATYANGTGFTFTHVNEGSAFSVTVSAASGDFAADTTLAGLTDTGSDVVTTDNLGGSYSASGNKITVTSGNYKGLEFTVASDSDSTITIGTNNALKMQIGANQDQNMSVGINDMRASALGVGDIDVTSQTNANVAVTTINNAIEKVSGERAKLGAYQNRLEHTINNLGTSAENLTASESRIRDVDMAKEMMEFTKNNILSQAAQAMLAQANQQPQGVLQLLR